MLWGSTGATIGFKFQTDADKPVLFSTLGAHGDLHAVSACIPGLGKVTTTCSNLLILSDILILQDNVEVVFIDDIEAKGLIEDWVGSSGFDSLGSVCLGSNRDDRVGIHLAKEILIFQALRELNSQHHDTCVEGHC